jgi:hypothetical protein
MIRLKCPKCAAPLAVDDDDAGGVGECGECSAKFRIPAAKTKAARVGEDDDKVAVGAPPARKRRAVDDEDDRPRRRRVIRDEDDDDDEEDDLLPRRPKKASNAQREQMRMNIQMGIALFGFVVVMGLASLFITGVGWFIAIASFVCFILTGLALFLTIYKESPAWALLILLVGTPAAVVYAIMNWDKVGKLVIIQFVFAMIALCGLFAGGINMGWREARRELRWKYIKPTSALMMRHVDAGHFKPMPTDNT